MDKNTLTGLILIGAVLFGFSYFSQPSQEEIDAANQTEVVAQSNDNSIDTNTQATTSAEYYDNEATPVDSTMLYALDRPLQNVILKNEKLTVGLHTRGAKAEYAELSGYLNQEEKPVCLFNAEDTHFNIPLISSDNKYIDTENCIFSLVSRTDSTAVFRLPLKGDAYLQYAYTLRANDYRLDLNITGHQLNEVLRPTQTDQKLEWKLKTIQQEQSHRFEGQYSGIYYYTKSGDNDDLTTSDEDSEEITDPLRWVAFKDKYFSSVLILNKEHFSHTSLNIKAMEEETGHVRDCEMTTTVPFDIRRGVNLDFTFFYGPNDYELLTSYDDNVTEDEELNLSHLVYLGWSLFRWVNKWVIIPIISLLKGFITNWGIIILLLTVIIKMALSPFTFKQYLAQAKMRLLKPQIEEINAKYEGKKDQDSMMKKQRETMELYSSAGASPVGGCLPLLLQMPFLIALYMYFPTSIFLRGESFLWAQDLSTYDAIISWDFDIPLITSLLGGNHLSLFCILMTVTNIIYTKKSTSQNPSAGGNEAMAVMKYMPYMMSIMFFFMFNSNASGLSYYYFISILITLLQFFASSLLIDDEKVLRQMEENKRKPKKKSKWIQRMEEAQRQREQQMKKQRR